MYSKILAFVICILSLVACGTGGGPVFEEGGFAETFTVPVEKGKMTVEMLVIFSGLPSQDKTVLLYKNLKPIMANVIKEEVKDWPAVQMFGHETYKSIDPNRALFKTILCERIKREFRKEMTSPTISQCLVIKLEKTPDKGSNIWEPKEKAAWITRLFYARSRENGLYLEIIKLRAYHLSENKLTLLGI